MPRRKRPAPADDERWWRPARRRSRRTRCAYAVGIPVRYRAAQRPAAPPRTPDCVRAATNNSAPATASGMRAVRDAARRSRCGHSASTRYIAPEWQRRGRMVKEGDGRGHSGRKVARDVPPGRPRRPAAELQMRAAWARIRRSVRRALGSTRPREQIAATSSAERRRVRALRPSAEVPICRPRAWRSAGAEHFAKA